MARKKKAAKRQFKGIVSRNAAKQQRGSQFGYLNLPKGIQMFKEEPGSRMNLDILPYLVTSDFHLDKDEEYGIAVKGSLWYKKPFWLHRNIGPDNRSVVCPTSNGQRCPICEYRAQQLKEGADWQDEAIRALKPSLRNLYVVVPKGHKKYEEIPHIWDMSQFLFQDSLNEEIQENEEHEVFPDLEEGLTLRIRFSEESFGNNKFAKTSRIDFRDRTKQYDESILKEVPNLDDILEILSPKTIETLFFGGVPEEDDEEQQPIARSSRKAKRVEYIEEDDDEEEEIEFVVNEDEDEIDDDDDDQEEYDDDEEEEYDDEEEEPPKPAPKTKKAATKTKKAPAAKKSKSKCPHGYKFGVDFEEHDECDECDLWEECMDAESSRK